MFYHMEYSGLAGASYPDDLVESEVILSAKVSETSESSSINLMVPSKDGQVHGLKHLGVICSGPR